MYIGIKDNGEICGVKNPTELLENLPNKINLTMGVVADVNLLKEGEKEYISITVKPTDRAISLKGKYYYRTGSTLQELGGSALQELLLAKIGRGWDDFACDNAKMDDIDVQAVDYFLRNAIATGRMPKEAANDSVENVLNNLNLLTEDGQIKNAAILLFGKNPQRRFISARFRIGRFGKDNTDLIRQDDIEGNIIQMADKVVWKLRTDYLIAPIHYEGMHRIEQLEIPEEALRELVYNAIVHRDYLGADTQMKVYDDHIWLWNDGELPQGFSIEKVLTENMSRPRNRLVASVFYKAGFIESWGRGISKVCNAFKEANLPVPTFENSFGGTAVTIPRNAALTQTPVVNDLTSLQNEILALIIADNSITTKQIAAQLGITGRTVQRHVAAMQKKGVLKREGTNKGKWVVVS